MPSKKERSEKLAINLFDLDRIDHRLRGSLLAGRLDLDTPVRTNWDRAASTTDETAVVFTCDLLMAAIICDTIRSYDRKVGDFPTRLYIYRKTWARIPSNQVLTELVAGKCQLDTRYFLSEIESIDPVPIVAEQVILGS